MFNRMKLKKYLIGMFSTIILMSAVITIAGVFGLVDLKSKLNVLVNEELASELAVKNCRIYANVAARDLREMLITEDSARRDSLKGNINTNLGTLKEELAVFKKTYGESDGYAAKYENAFNEWIEIASRAMSAIDKGNEKQAQTIIANECSPALSNLAEIAKEINRIADNDVENLTKKMELLNSAYLGVITIVFLLVAFVSIVMALKATKNITGITAKIMDAVNALSKGDLSARMDYTGDNEFGELADKINFSFEELGRYVNAIDREMEEFSNGNFTYETQIKFLGDFENIQKFMGNFQKKMNDTLLELGDASTQVSAGSSQVADSAQALAQGATEQASSVEELSATITDISSHISDTAEFSQKANELGVQAGAVVERSKEEMTNMLGAIRDIATASENIQKIIKAIDDIAFQTNILALNAAVEAARAGNAGKGFAVVADEVRNLAQKSAEAAKNTTELIENSLAHVAKGEKLAESTGEAFAEVAKYSDDIMSMVAKIAEASKEQAQSISQISQGVDQISAVVQMNSATSEESAAASQELSGQAAVMKSLIDQFKLKKKAGSAFQTNGSTDHSSAVAGKAAAKNNTASTPSYDKY